MPERLIEPGIGETRAALIDGGRIVETRIELEGATPAGAVLAARLVSTGAGGRNAVARDETGREYLLPRGAPRLSEGAALNIEITRERIPGAEQWKRPLARATDAEPGLPPPLEERLGARRLRFPAPDDELGFAGWVDVIDEARTGSMQFQGGELRISATPAMTLIDVDGYLAPDELAIAGARAAARAIRRLDIGGSIGMDLPTTSSKACRLAAASAIDEHLPQPFERTAVNGFGFVQVVRPRLRASLVELAQERAGFEVRALLRRAASEAPGSKRLVGHPAVTAALEARPEWLAELAGQIGGAVSLRADAALPMSGGYAEPA